MDPLAQILLLLGVAVAIVVGFQRLHVPSSLGYLLVGLLVGPFTIGPVVDLEQIRTVAEFGIVFLLFTIGLNFSLPQLHALRHQVLWLGTGQIVLTTTAVGVAAWLMGLPPAAAFVVGAVFAQSSTTIIGKQLVEQGEDNSRHGRLGLAMSVFQDVTAVPFVVIIPVLGVAAGVWEITGSLGWALAKAALALGVVVVVGRRLMRPLFHLVSRSHSTELFTLTVLLVALAAAWTTNSLGLSLAFGAFLAGMMLGETEFRHQVESAIRPFRDVLLGLFFIGIGMLFDPRSLPQIWHLALAGAGVLILIKTITVAILVRRFNLDMVTSWRVGLLLAVGGEFGFALISIALGATIIDSQLGQIILTAVLFSMITGPFIIRYNEEISRWLAGFTKSDTPESAPASSVDTRTAPSLDNHVIICGYGRIGQGVAHLLEAEQIPYIALDLDSARVRQAHTAGEPVFYGDASDKDILEAVGLSRARLVIISYEDAGAALKILASITKRHPHLPIMVRTRDESRVDELREAGAIEVVPETLEASLMIASQALLLLDVPITRVVRHIQKQRAERYRLVRTLFRAEEVPQRVSHAEDARLRSVVIPPESPSIGHELRSLEFKGIAITALVRDGHRLLNPPPETRLQKEDVVVIFGAVDDLTAAENALIG